MVAPDAVQQFSKQMEKERRETNRRKWREKTNRTFASAQVTSAAATATAAVFFTTNSIVWLLRLPVNAFYSFCSECWGHKSYTFQSSKIDWFQLWLIGNVLIRKRIYIRNWIADGGHWTVDTFNSLVQLMQLNQDAWPIFWVNTFARLFRNAVIDRWHYDCDSHTHTQEWWQHE